MWTKYWATAPRIQQEAGTASPLPLPTISAVCCFRTDPIVLFSSPHVCILDAPRSSPESIHNCLTTRGQPERGVNDTSVRGLADQRWHCFQHTTHTRTHLLARPMTTMTSTKFETQQRQWARLAPPPRWKRSSRAVKIHEVASWMERKAAAVLSERGGEERGDSIQTSGDLRVCPSCAEWGTMIGMWGVAISSHGVSPCLGGLHAFLHLLPLPPPTLRFSGQERCRPTRVLAGWTAVLEVSCFHSRKRTLALQKETSRNFSKREQQQQQCTPKRYLQQTPPAQQR